jgi:adenylate kinase
MPHISTGDLFRSVARSGNELGRRFKAYMDAGELVPDEVVIGVVAERLTRDDAVHQGFILDGFPRTRPQAEELEKVLAPEILEATIYLELLDKVVLSRLTGRRVCRGCGANYHIDAPPRYDWRCDGCGGDVVQRDDDNDAAIMQRLKLYHEHTRPLIHFYGDRGVLVPVDGLGTVDEVFWRVVEAVQSAIAQRV